MVRSFLLAGRSYRIRGIHDYNPSGEGEGDRSLVFFDNVYGADDDNEEGVVGGERCGRQWCSSSVRSSSSSEWEKGKPTMATIKRRRKKKLTKKLTSSESKVLQKQYEKSYELGR